MISRRGKPCAVLVGIENYNAEDLALARSEDFWRMIRLRGADGKSSTLAEVEARLGITSAMPAAKLRQGRRRASSPDRTSKAERRPGHRSLARVTVFWRGAQT